VGLAASASRTLNPKPYTLAVDHGLLVVGVGQRLLRGIIDIALIGSSDPARKCLQLPEGL